MFKFVVLCALVAAASAVSKFGAPNYNQRPAVRSGATGDEAHAQTNSYVSDVRADGFQYAFDTTNGIRAAASGDAYGNAKGDFAWVSPEGVPVSVQYVADENGYQPHSDLLPTPPPVPAAILKSLEYIRTHPQYVEPARNYAHSPAKTFTQNPVRNFAQSSAKKIVQAPARNFVKNTGKNFGRRF